MLYVTRDFITKRSLPCFGMFLLCCGAFSLTGQAATDDYFDLAPEQLLSAQVVSASKKIEDVADVPAAVYVITQEDIARSGLTSVPELLRLAPGVDVARADSNSWAVSIRGFNSTSANKILVMIDGRTVYNPLFAGTFWEVQDLPLEDISRIEIVRGPGGALWGANAVNGVINIITKNAAETQGGLVSAGAGNYENGFVTTRYGGKIGDKTYYRAYARAFDRGSFKDPDGGQGNDGWQNYRTGFRTDWGDRESADRITVHGDLYRTNTDELNQSFSLTAPYSWTQEETIKSGGGNILGVWRHNYDDGSTLKLQSFVDFTTRKQMLLNDRRSMLDVDIQYNPAHKGRHEIAIGGNYRLTMDNIGGSSEIDFDPASLTQNLFGLFAQDKITLVPDNWFLTVGTKFERNDYTGLEIQPSASLQWTPDERQTVWASVSRAVRTPSRIERDLSISNIVLPPGIFGPNPAEYVLTENKDFDSEKLVAYEVGYRNKITPSMSIDTTAFVNDYDSLASSTLLTPFTVNNGVDPIHLVLPVLAENRMSGQVYGFELAGSWSVTDDWKLSASYSYLDTELHAPLLAGQSQEGAEGRSPQNQANIRSYWNMSENWTLDTMAYYVDSLPKDDISHYIRLDMNLGWRINDSLHLNLVGQNMFGGSRREFGPASNVNTTEPGTSIFGKVTWQF